MRVINIHEAKTQFFKLVEAVSLGDEIIIVKAGKPAAKLVPMAYEKSAVRQPGSMKGQIRIADDFDAPLPDELLGDFAGN